MENEHKNIGLWAGLFAFVLLLFFIIGVSWSLIKLVGMLEGLEAKILAPTLVGFVTVLGSVLAVVIAKYLEKQKEIEFELRKKRAEVYENFAKIVLQLVLSHKTRDQEFTVKELIEMMEPFTRGLMIWGSDEVVTEYIKFRAIAVMSRPPAEVSKSLESVLFAMRKDMGYKNKNLKQRDLLSLFVNPETSA